MKRTADGDGDTFVAAKKKRCLSTEELEYDQFYGSLLIACNERYGTKINASIIQSSATYVWKLNPSSTFQAKIDHALSTIHDMYNMYA